MKYNILKLGLLLVGICGAVSAASVAYVPKAAPGDTATAGAGKQWPTNRFVVNGDCVTDNLTGLMWAKDANSFGNKKWRDGASPNYTYPAQESVNAMNGSDPSATGYHLCGYSDWRLPNQKELLSLLNYAAGTGNGNQVAWLTSQNFTNVQSNRYWSSTAYDSSNAWYVNTNNGTNGKLGMTGAGYVWPVRGGK